jgi:hypothetical protein
MTSRIYPEAKGGLKSRYVDGVLTFYNADGNIVYTIDPANRTLAIPSGSVFSLAGTSAGTDDASWAKTITSATPSTERLIKGALTLTPATTMSVAAGGSLAGVRGEATVSAGKTFVDGFLYGAQGKCTLNGALAESAAGRIAGVLGQVDLAAGTVTAGQVSGVWADLQGAPTLTVPDQVFPLRVTNSMSVNAYAMAFFHGKATYFLSVNEPSASFIGTGAVGGSQDKKLKCIVGGTTYYLPLYTS